MFWPNTEKIAERRFSKAFNGVHVAMVIATSEPSPSSTIQELTHNAHRGRVAAD